MTKISTYIQYREAINFISKSNTAILNETPWNCLITVNIQQGKIAPQNASKHFRRGVYNLTRYNNKHNIENCYGWVLENAPKIGVHGHLTLYRPKVLPMHPLAYWWAVLKCFNLEKSKGIIRVRKFYSWQSYAKNLDEVTKYMLKGIRQELAAEFDCNYKNQGKIYSKRIGWSK